MEKFEQQNNPETISKFEDFRGLDLSGKDLRAIPVEVLITADFDTQTTWPEQNKLPAGFNPEKIIDEAKNPGLGIGGLHQKGIDGRGVRVAIIDQTLSSETGEFVAHSEYATNIIDYKEYGDAKDESVSMHGPAVVSLLVGKTCGVASRAELFYRATPSGRDFDHKADALFDIIEFNRTLPPKDRIRVVSCSVGYMEEKPEPGLKRWIEAIKKAETEGIIVSDVGDRTGVDYIGGGTSDDKNDPENYSRALFSKDQGNEELDKVFAESDGGVDLILRKIREIKKDEVSNIPDSVLREKIQKAVEDRGKEIIIPCDYRTMASNEGSEEYMYNGKGGMSWAVPFLSGLFALAFQVNPNLAKEEIADAINTTASVSKKGLKVVNPRAFIEAIQI
ncbi:MAG: S8/S53 family peptidase [Candidatus Nealsonbacteria bacterium DGGOD1a]|nr:MAG: S8/S53 family peptidase [Candidatus Nealsonbacteria bacterium DGGOD1a]